MGKSLRSKTKLKYRNERRHTIYEAEEDARRQRLAAKLMGQVKEVAKEEKKAARAGASDDVEIVDKDTQEKGDENKDEEMDVDSTKPKKASTSGWKKKAKKQRSIRRKR